MNAAFPAFKAIDISVTLRKGLACWPGEDFWSFEPVHRSSEGGPCNVSKFAMGCHMGTHVDAPWHFDKSAETVERVSLEKLVLPARVIDLTHVERAITRRDLEGKLDGVRAVLLKTRNSGKLERLEPFDTEFVHPDITAADYLMEMGIITFAVDYCSIDGFHAQGAPVHHRILKDIFVIEGVDLSGVEPKDYLLIALPLKIAGADGAPARVVLLDLQA